MFKKILTTLSFLVSVGCNPSYATEAIVLTEQNCKTAKVISRQIVINMQQGESQYEVMNYLNKEPIETFGKNGDIVKLYLQINVSAFNRNVNKGFRVNEILRAVEKDCSARIGKAA